MSNLTGKTALVTGGSRGMGAATVRELTRRGAAVAFTYANSAEAAEQLVKEVAAEGGRALAIRAEAADAAETVAAVERAAAELGGLDILVNNVGQGAMGPFHEMPLEDLDRLLAVNVRSVVLTSQAAVRHLRDGGSVVTLGSTAASKSPGAGLTLYTMTKSALVGLTKGMAHELGGRGITVNGIQPGPIDTDMNPADGPFADAQRASTALGRYGTAEEVAGLVGYVTSEAARYVTGAVLTIDGGHAA